MDIRKRLLKGSSKTLTNQIIAYIGAHRGRFNTLMKVFAEGPALLTQRAAPILSYCVENHPTLLKNAHYKLLLTMLDHDFHDAVKRNIVRTLQFVPIPGRFQAKTIEHCFRLMQPAEPVAVRVFAMTVAANLARQIPDLKTELKLVIEDQFPFASAGYRSRAKKILKQLEK